MAWTANVTVATPEELAVAITLLPLVVPLESAPAEVENNTLAPEFLNPEDPGFSVTVRGCTSAVPADPVWLFLALAVSVPAGFPTTIHPIPFASP